MHGAVHCGNNEPPISPLTTNQTAHIEKPENQSLWGYRFRVVPWRDKVSAFPRGFFIPMTTSQANTPERHPARFRSDRKEMLNLSFDQETFDQLASLAQAERCSVPALICKAVKVAFLDSKNAADTAKPSKPPLAHYLKAGKQGFAAYARKFAEVEQAADLDAGSLVEALLSGMPDNSPSELAGWIASGWICSQEEDDLEAALVPVFKRWE